MNTQSPQREPSAADPSAHSTRSSGSGQAGAEPDAKPGPTPDESAAEAFRQAGQRLAEIKAYAVYYLQAQADRLRLAAREAMFAAFFAPIALLVISAVVIVAVVLLLVGLANGIGGALGNRIWLGEIIVAVGVLVTVPFVARLLISRFFAMFRKKTVAKYEYRKLQQRTRFGHDVKQRAQQADR
jgi:hypothetical protein